MSSPDSRLKRTRVSTRRWRNRPFGVTRQIAGIDAMVAAGEQPQALRRLVEHLRLGQDAAADGDHGIGGEDERAFELLVGAHHRERRLGLLAREPRGEARGSSPRFGVSSISAGSSASGSMPAWLRAQAGAASRRRERVSDGRSCACDACGRRCQSGHARESARIT